MYREILVAGYYGSPASAFMLRSLVRRGLKIDGGVLVVSDGGTSNNQTQIGVVKF